MAGALGHAIAHNLPELEGSASGEASQIPPERAPERWLALGGSGYIQVIDYRAIARLAQRADLVVRLAVRSGHFVLAKGRHIALLSSRADELADEIRSQIVIGPEQSPAQDLEYAVRQLVEIALRALSPGINATIRSPRSQPWTISVRHWATRLGGGLPETVIRDDQGQVRALASAPDFAGLVDAAFNQIRQAGRESAAVLIELADILGKLAPAVRTPAQRQAILDHLGLVERAGGRHLEEARDKADLAGRIAAARRGLAESAG